MERVSSLQTFLLTHARPSKQSRESKSFLFPDDAGTLQNKVRGKTKQAVYSNLLYAEAQGFLMSKTVSALEIASLFTRCPASYVIFQHFSSIYCYYVCVNLDKCSQQFLFIYCHDFLCPLNAHAVLGKCRVPDLWRLLSFKTHYSKLYKRVCICAGGIRL